MANSKDIQDFIVRWQKAEGNEQRESTFYWLELCNLLGVEQPMRVLDFERKVDGNKRMDIFYEDMGILIENKSRGIDLDKQYERGVKRGKKGIITLETPYQQAKSYRDALPPSIAPRWIVVCNFDTIRVHDLEKNNPEQNYCEIQLNDLENGIRALSFFTDKSHSRLFIEKSLSTSVGKIVRHLYNLLRVQYTDIAHNKHEQHSLNVLIVRLMFLLYAENTGLLHCRKAFYEYMKNIPAHRMCTTLGELFKVLDIPREQRKEVFPYIDPEMNKFPYINGGLFADSNILIPQFTEEIKTLLLEYASNELNWSNISPTIFGAIFEDTLNDDTREEGGMHYTSIENIHRVIDPLFLNDLRAELCSIENLDSLRDRENKLVEFCDKLRSLKFLDPACGSGNFLTEAYISLCKLELRAREGMPKGSILMFTDSVSIHQFYGIEINDFAVAVAKTALYIAEQQMLTRRKVQMPYYNFDFLPLTTNNNINVANALCVDWNEYLPASECDYIMGNPPFNGANSQNSRMKEELRMVFDNAKNCGIVDYVSGWFVKTAQYMTSHARAAFVSTSSICQGEQVATVWKPVYQQNCHIDFAHNPFKWRNEANEPAQVSVIIVGFSKAQNTSKTLYWHKDPEADEIDIKADSINAYLLPNTLEVLIERRNNPLCNVPRMTKGCQPTDGGHLIIKAEEYDNFIAKEPEAQYYIKKLVDAKHYLNRKPHYCLWLDGVSDQKIAYMPYVQDRVNKCREMRLNSSQPATRKLACKPTVFRETYNPDTCLLIPSTTSERRDYIPLGFLQKDTISTNANLIVQNATLFHFGVLQSKLHHIWFHTICGRLDNRVRYSAQMVYNNFPFPTPNEKQYKDVEQCAQAVLDVRERYPDLSLEILYNSARMPNDLREAHEQLDQAVERAYGIRFNGNEEKIVTHLFKLYKELTENE